MVFSIVLQHDDRAIILRGVVVVESVNGPIQRRIDWSAGWGEQIDAEMDGAIFIRDVFAGGEGRGGVKVACFVVAPDAYTSTCF